jgi:hypothetical protein
MDIKGIALAKQMDDRRNVLRYPNGPLSPAAPIVPTYMNFDAQAPANLEKATNNDFDDPVGTGIRTVEAAGNIGGFIFDLGSIKNVFFGLKCSVWSDGSTYICYLQGSNDGTNYKLNVALHPSIATNSDGVTTSTMDVGNFVRGRYIRVFWRLAGAATGNVKLFEAFAHEIGI